MAVLPQNVLVGLQDARIAFPDPLGLGSSVGGGVVLRPVLGVQRPIMVGKYECSRLFRSQQQVVETVLEWLRKYKEGLTGITKLYEKWKTKKNQTIN